MKRKDGQIFQTITVDFTARSLSPQVSAKQYDDCGRLLAVTLVEENGARYLIPENSTVRIRLKKADGKNGLYDCVYEESTVFIELSAQMLAAAGIATCEIEIIKDELLLKTASFQLMVQQAVYQDDEVISEDEYASLEGMWAQCTQAARIAQESAELATQSASAIQGEVEKAKEAATQAAEDAQSAQGAAQLAQQAAQSVENAAEAAAESAQEAAESAEEIGQISGEILSAVEQAETAAESAAESAQQAEQNTEAAGQLVEQSAGQVAAAQQAAEAAQLTAEESASQVVLAQQAATQAAQSAQQAAESVASIGDSVEQAAESASAAAESASEAAADAAEVSQKVDGFRGSFENPAALKEAYPTSANGDWAVVQDNRSIWVYDTALSLWVESGSSYNYLINPGFLINQRGQASYSTTGVGFDMWWNNYTTGNVSATVTTEAVAGQTEKAAVVTCTAVSSTSNTDTLFFQQIEDVNGKSLVAGKRVTFSFFYQTAVDYRAIFVAYRPQGSEAFTILKKPIAASPDEYVQAYYTVDIPEGATAVQFGVWTNRVLTSADIGTEFRMTCPQVVEGDSPRAWEPVDMMVDLAKCQRFYERINNIWGCAINSSILWQAVPFKVEKAKIPVVYYGYENTPNVVQVYRPSGQENLPLATGSITADTKAAYVNGTTSANDIGRWICYVEATVLF